MSEATGDTGSPTNINGIGQLGLRVPYSGVEEAV